MGGARVSDIFTKNPYLKKIFFGGGEGVGIGVDGRTDEQAQPICPFNLSEVEGITVHKCTSYGPDKLNL